MSVSVHHGELSEPRSFARHKMVHLLPQMNLLLLRPRRPRLPCLVRITKDWVEAGLLFESGTCCDLMLVKDRKHPNSLSMLMMVIWEDTSVRCFVNYWLEHQRIYLGSHAVRVIQRVWRRHCEQRRLAVCMGWREEGSLLGCVLRTLCVEDLKHMVP